MQTNKTVTVIEIRPPRPAPDVAYTSMPGTPKLYFACAPYRATLSQDACGSRWRMAQDASGMAADRVALCRGCPIGAHHAGHDVVFYSRHYQAPICPRCRKGSLRIIGDRVCVSCFNREGEMQRGHNARGTPLKVLSLRPPVDRRLIEIVGGEPRTVEVRGVVDLAEAALRRLRTGKGEFAFGFRGDESGLKQLRLL